MDEEERQAWANIRLGFEDSKRRNDEVSAQMKETDARIAKTEAIVAEVSAQIKETGVQMKETDARIAAMFAESRAEAEKRQAEYEKQQAEYEKQQAEYEKRYAEAAEKRHAEYVALAAESKAEFDRRSDKLDARIAHVTENINGISDSNGLFAEELFFNTLSEKKVFAGIHFDDVDDGFGYLLKLPGGKRLKDQFDIVMLNDVAVAIIEAKYKARKADVKTLAEKKVENFKILFPAYKDFKIYLGLGALAFEDDVVDEARKYGVGLLKQVGNTIEYDTEWEVKAY